jgi:hypothetical protein
MDRLESFPDEESSGKSEQLICSLVVRMGADYELLGVVR